MGVRSHPLRDGSHDPSLDSTRLTTVATTPLREQKTIMKVTAGPHCTGQLVNHRHAPVTAGTVALRHATSRHGKQANDDHAWTYDDAKTRQDGLPAKFTRFSLPGALDHSGLENPSLCM